MTGKAGEDDRRQMEVAYGSGHVENYTVNPMSRNGSSSQPPHN